MNIIQETQRRLVQQYTMFPPEYFSYIQRVVVDSSVVISNNNTAKVIRELKRVYGTLANHKLIWTCEMGSKQRTSGVVKYASKTYSADQLATHNDAVQATTASQPIFEKTGAIVNNTSGNRGIIYPEITFSATDSWIVTTVLNWNGSDTTYSKFAGQNFGNSWLGLRNTTNKFTFRNNAGTISAGGSASTGIIGKNTIISFAANGTGNVYVYVSGVLIDTFTQNSAITLSVMLSDFVVGRYFYGKLYATIIKSGTWIEQNIISEHNFLSILYPELHTTRIGDYYVAQSNLDVVSSANATLIADGAVIGTWITGASAWCYHSGSVGISGKLYNKAAKLVIAANPPAGYHVATEIELATIAAIGGTALKSALIISPLHSSRNADGSYNTWDATATYWCADSDKVLKLDTTDSATIIDATANEGHAIMLIKDGSVETIDPSITDHRYDAEMAISQSTDTINPTSRYGAELFGFKHNVALEAFINNYTDNDTDKADCELTGRINFDLYFPSDMWKNPISGVIEVIPDYYEAAWTSAGVAAFTGALLGVAKATKYPSHCQEMYDVTSGAYGYDLVNDVSGASNLSELYLMCDYIIAYYNTLLGKKMSVLSYRNGDDSASTLLMPKTIIGRNSGYSINGDSLTEYGNNKGLPSRALTRANTITKASSTRWWDAWNSYGLTEAQANTYCSGEITKTIANKGWFSDFIHWHNPKTANDLDALNRWFSLINTTIGASFVHRCSFSEASEYLILKEIIKDVKAFEYSGKVKLAIQVVDLYKGLLIDGILQDIDFTLLKTPVSVKIDLSNSSLANKNIKTDSTGIRSLGSNQYVVDITLSLTSDGYQYVTIEEETGSTSYYNFDLPQIISATVSNQVLTVTTNVPTKCAVFIAERNAAIDTSILLSRSNTLTTTHTISLINANQAKDIYVGIITKEKQSILSNVYRFV